MHAVFLNLVLRAGLRGYRRYPAKISYQGQKRSGNGREHDDIVIAVDHGIIKKLAESIDFKKRSTIKEPSQNYPNEPAKEVTMVMPAFLPMCLNKIVGGGNLSLSRSGHNLDANLEDGGAGKARFRCQAAIDDGDKGRAIC